MIHPLKMRTTLVAMAISLGACNNRQVSVGSATNQSSAGGHAETFSAITFERTPCFGTCPVYKLSVAGDGAVVFEGTRNVDSIGRHLGRLDAEHVASLRRAFDDAQYFTLDDKYAYGQANCREYGADAPRILTSLTAPDKTKHIEHDLGCANVPARLADLYKHFDAIVGTSRWVGRR